LYCTQLRFMVVAEELFRWIRDRTAPWTNFSFNLVRMSVKLDIWRTVMRSDNLNYRPS
jgi:hypothetical protein